MFFAWVKLSLLKNTNLERYKHQIGILEMMLNMIEVIWRKAEPVYQ